MTGFQSLLKFLGRVKRSVRLRLRAPSIIRTLTCEIEELRRQQAALERKLIEQRNAHEQAKRELWNVAGKIMNSAVVHAIQHSSADAHFECVFNGVPAMLPRDTLRTFPHCLHVQIDAPFVVEVEIAHQRWLSDKLRPGDVFLDVGAATGAMTIPIARLASQPRIIAFEPSRSTNRALHETLRRNGISRVEVIDAAVSDRVGVATFAELKFDTTGQMPWLPEGSAIINDAIVPDYISETYEAPTITLDAFFASRPDGGAVRSIKIDVEGFEVHVLRGALSFLALARPYIAIDIHRDPFGEGTTEAGVRACLDTLGYRFEKAGHVLLCSALPD